MPPWKCAPSESCKVDKQTGATNLGPAVQRLLLAELIDGPMSLTHVDYSQSNWQQRLHRQPSARYRCTNVTAIAPSPTADAQRFTAPRRTSPTAKMPGTLVSR